MSENVHGWSTEEVVGLLQKVDLFEGLPAEDHHRIAAIVAGTSLEAGEVLFEEGEPGDAFYIVFKGAVEITKSRPDGSTEKLAVRRGGEGFGEMALLNDAPRSARARALEVTQLMTVSRDDFERLLGGDSLPLRMMQALSKALRALGIRFASVEKLQDAGARMRVDAHEVSRVMQAGLLPSAAPRVEGFDVAAGTTTEDAGRGGSVWDWLSLGDGRTALLTLDVRQDGFPAAHHLGVARAVLRGLAADHATPSQLLVKSNEALSAAAIEGLDQFVEVGILVMGPDGVEWASAGRVPGGLIRRNGTFEEFSAHGPPLGMMGGFKYKRQSLTMGSGDTAFVLSHASPGLFMGAADLMAQLHGKPAGEVVSTLHKAIRKAQGDQRSETSVLYARKH
ncbi:MAG: cyclic nucleotide-binding domain-containing protein [Longimicrobiales bacterium]|nr:cyclic nucleotide-binding domain-containing protein [Longimicrobiales bacterium]